MGHSEILELERLANQSQLVAPFEYRNPDIIGEIFYEFIKSYGNKLEIVINEEKEGFIDYKWNEFVSVIGSFRYLYKSYLNKSFMCFLESAGNILRLGLDLILTPIAYPLGGAVGYVYYEDNKVSVKLPTFTGLLNLDLFFPYKPHEYMHVYHLLVAEDLKRRSLLQKINGYLDVGWTEPPYEVPSYEILKKFERKFLHAMIREESRHFKSQT